MQRAPRLLVHDVEAAGAAARSRTLLDVEDGLVDRPGAAQRIELGRHPAGEAGGRHALVLDGEHRADPIVVLAAVVAGADGAVALGRLALLGVAAAPVVATP